MSLQVISLLLLQLKDKKLVTAGRQPHNGLLNESLQLNSVHSASFTMKMLFWTAMIWVELQWLKWIETSDTINIKTEQDQPILNTTNFLQLNAFVLSKAKINIPTYFQLQQEAAPLLKSHSCMKLIIDIFHVLMADEFKKTEQMISWKHIKCRCFHRGHDGSLNDMMNMNIICHGLCCHQISTQLNTCRTFWSFLHHH